MILENASMSLISSFSNLFLRSANYATVIVLNCLSFRVCDWILVSILEEALSIVRKSPFGAEAYLSSYNNLRGLKLFILFNSQKKNLNIL